jgi:hypothetical protein
MRPRIDYGELQPQEAEEARRSRALGVVESQKASVGDLWRVDVDGNNRARVQKESRFYVRVCHKAQAEPVQAK